MNRERDAHDNFPPLVPVASGRWVHIVQAFETCVMQHPARIGGDSHSLISGKAYSAVLVAWTSCAR